MFLESLFDDPAYYLSVVVVVMFSIVLHELSHGWAALWEGDITPEASGHMDLNPMTHMGPMAIAALFLVGISWGMMPVNPLKFRHGRKGEALVAFAGPASNLVLVVVFALLWVLWQSHGLRVVDNFGLYKNLGQFFFIGSVYNGALFLLNMIPVPPLDGFTVATSLSDSFRGHSEFLHQYGMIIFLGIFFIGSPLLFKGGAWMTQLSAMGFKLIGL